VTCASPVVLALTYLAAGYTSRLAGGVISLKRPITTGDSAQAMGTSAPGRRRKRCQRHRLCRRSVILEGGSSGTGIGGSLLQATECHW
jgi:hypothetical protein